MDDMEYPGIRFHINALFEQMVTPIKIDISTGDVITPRAIEYNYVLMLEDRKIELWSYNLETILAEKLQTILVRERANTRMRDFYDIYVLMDMYSQKVDASTLNAAYMATCKKRGSLHIMGNEASIVDIIANDEVLNKQWRKYQEKFTYAANIDFAETISAIKLLLSNIA